MSYQPRDVADLASIRSTFTNYNWENTAIKIISELKQRSYNSEDLKSLINAGGFGAESNLNLRRLAASAFYAYHHAAPGNESFILPGHGCCAEFYGLYGAFCHPESKLQTRSYLASLDHRWLARWRGKCQNFGENSGLFQKMRQVVASQQAAEAQRTEERRRQTEAQERKRKADAAEKERAIAEQEKRRRAIELAQAEAEARKQEQFDLESIAIAENIIKQTLEAVGERVALVRYDDGSCVQEIKIPSPTMPGLALLKVAAAITTLRRNKRNDTVADVIYDKLASY